MKKTHFMSRKTHSTDQGKMCNQPEYENQAETDQNKPKYPSKSVGQAMPHGLRTRDTRTAQISSLGAVGASGRTADHHGRPTKPMGPTASALTRCSSSLAPKVGSKG